MTTEQAQSLSETAISKLMEALERGQSEALRAYVSLMSRGEPQVGLNRFYCYSWGNNLLIYSQRPDARCWFPCLAQDAPLCPEGREGHRHPGTDGLPEEVRRRVDGR